MRLLSNIVQFNQMTYSSIAPPVYAHKKNLLVNEKGYDKSETTYEKLSARIAFRYAVTIFL